MAGGPIWCDRKRVFHGIAPIVDLSDGWPAEIEDAFEDGSFVIRRTSDRAEDRPAGSDLYEMYNPDGRLLRSIAIPRPDPKGFGVGDGEEVFFSMPWLYRLAFEGSGARIERY